MEAKHWGPFNGRQLTTMICVVAVAILFPVTAHAAVSGSSVFVTDASTGKHAAVDASGSVRTFALPANWFSLPPQQSAIVAGGSATVKPDPSGMRYAITSFDVSNPTASPQTVTITSFASSATLTDCGGIFNVVDSAPGPVLTVPANSSDSLTFPTPFITKAVKGKSVCIAAGGAGLIGLKWSMVGYRLPT